MSENKTPTDGGTAFPRPFSEDTYIDYEAQEGMSLRDYFAGKAMQVLAQGNYFDATARKAYMIAAAMLREGEKGNYFDATARQAYMIADAMLREREK